MAGGDGGGRCGLSGFVPGRENEKTHGPAVLLGFYLAVIVTFTLGHRIPKQGYDYKSCML